jgi:hypothetical protein
MMKADAMTVLAKTRAHLAAIELAIADRAKTLAEYESLATALRALEARQAREAAA